MGDPNKILTAANAPLSISNIVGAHASTATIQGVPLGTADGSATGELAAKVILVGGGAATGAAVTTTVGAASGASIVSSTSLAASKILKASAGTLISLVGYNSGSAQFVQIHNSATLPAEAAVPIYTFAVAATSNFSIDIPITGAPFSTGITACNSSTAATKTIGSADCWFTAVIK